MLRSQSVARVGALLVAFSGERAVMQIPPETSLYELIDIVPPPPPVTCECVAGAFALPGYRPWPGAIGPGAPIYQVPGAAQASGPRDAERRAEERERLPRNAEDGFAGNGNASLSVAMHLREASLAAGIPAPTEEEAARWLHLAATQDHRDAFMFLGYRFQRGEGVPQSDESAAYWFHQSALRGDKTSMVALGFRYAAGRGVPQDYAAAVQWWRRATATHSRRDFSETRMPAVLASIAIPIAPFVSTRSPLTPATSAAAFNWDASTPAAARRRTTARARRFTVPRAKVTLTHRSR